jgi:hypothetical protein
MRRFLLQFKTQLNFLKHLPIWLQMRAEHKQGKKIIAYQLGSEGQLQYTMPVHQQLLQYAEQFSFYLCSNYPMPQVAQKMSIDAKRCIPADIAKYMTGIDAFVCAEIHSKGPQQAVTIFSGHGHANKLTNWAEENLKSLDIYFLCSPLERAMFGVIQAANPEASKHIELVNIGYPKTDDLVNRQFDRAEIFARLGLDANLKTVLYAPAWDPGGSLRTYGAEVIETLLSIPDINVLVKLHPASMEKPHSPYFEFYTGGKVWQDEFKRFQDHPRFRFINELVINPYLFISDLMVNDFSGVALEYMALNRPIIYMDCPEYYEKTLPSWKCDPHLAKHDERFNAGRHVGSEVFSLEQLKQQVIVELNEPALNESKRQEFRQKVMYNPGQGAYNAANEIRKRLKLKIQEN